VELSTTIATLAAVVNIVGLLAIAIRLEHRLTIIESDIVWLLKAHNCPVKD